MIRSAVLLTLLALQGAQPDIVLDDFETTNGWKTTPSDGVSLELHEDAGIHGRSMRLDFDFHGHGGYAVIHKDIKVTVPGNYEFSFYVRGPAPLNTLEFKLIDPTGDNVWWSNQPNFVFPADWKRVVRKKRHISFAWGPIGGGELKNVAAIEFAITAGTGGKGSVWLDDLRLTPLPPEGPYTLTPKVTSSSSVSRHDAAMAIDGNAETSWRVAPGQASTLDIDFLRRREFGGLIIDWEKNARPSSYEISMSIDGEVYTRAYSVRPNASLRDHVYLPSSQRDYIYLPEADARYLRISVRASNSFVGLKEISVKPLAWSASMNDFLKSVAKDAPAGSYPRYFSNKQSYWTVVGVNGDTHEGLLDTRGMLETGKAQFSVEPFLRTNGHLVTWADATPNPSDADGYLPIPSVTWPTKPLELTVTSFATGTPGASILFGAYRIHNTTTQPQQATLYLAMRPFQVNPPWQFLNTAGGFAPIDSISFDGNVVHINNDRVVVPVSRPVAFGALSFTEGPLVDLLRAGRTLTRTSTVDELGLASGVMSYNLTLGPNADSVIYIAIPLHDSKPACILTGCSAKWAASALDSAKATWRTTLGTVQIDLPPSAARIAKSIQSNLAYILINRDGAAIQPGSRSYERSWIRDGSLTSAALLRLGHAKEVKEFIEWFAPYQFDNGKIPCCVDARGSDPVPENDSHGEFIYLVAEYFRHTGDRETLNAMWPHVANAISYMDSLRHSRMTREFQTGDKKVFYGLLPQSISHEGYSAKPMHSYWDDFFALRGYKDAAEIARILGKPEAARYAAERDTFQVDLHASIALAMKNHKIDYVPGAAELGDFDATSTTIAVNPAGELGTSIEPAIRRTFDRYYTNFIKRRDSGKPWDIYTPYEWRVAGTYVRLGQRQRAQALVNFFFQHQRPKEWHQWAEVVMQKEDSAHFIGDMPHTWVGSDFIRSALDMFAYERDTDSSLVIGAGIPASWTREGNGVGIKNLSTYYGLLSYTMRATPKGMEVKIESGLRMPRGGIIVKPPLGRETKVTSLPATLRIAY
jgi:hypothetical protein